MAFRAIRWVYQSLFPAARNSLNLALLITVDDLAIRRLEVDGINRVLVLSPHPDDEAIGCGGTILLHKQAGANITVVYMTDGRWGGENWHSELLPEDEQVRRQLQFTDMRKAEASECAKVLNLDRQVFLDIEDGRVTPTKSIINALCEVIEEEKPEVIYVPFLMESHPDHWQTARILEHCLARQHAPQTIIRSYEVWRPLVANRLADISSVEDIKRKAIAAYRSQIEERDYISYIMGLNRYRAMQIRAGFAEAFFDATPEEFCYLVRSASRSRIAEPL
jgi:LmbE family N-acetylglucosaminyl deacetylase